MTEVLVHRGPDDFGYLVLASGTGRYALGHTVALDGSADVLLGSRRLAIVDLSTAARQPMANARGDVFVVFNGAVYNHPELRRELEGHGHRFHSGSDTEVVLHAYEQWGDACVGRFNGMWAFAVWDQRRRRLLCSRDRFGVKPFYYRLDDDAFAFGSEVKAILQAIDGPVTPHVPTIAAFLEPGVLSDGDATFFAGVTRLPAAHNLVVTADRVELTRYWDYTTRSHAYDVREPEETFAELLDDAVRLHLRADVPVGVALSGGTDSSTVTALARRHLGSAPLRAFHAAFPGRRIDERRYAELVARRFDAELHVVEYRPAELLADIEHLVWHMDHPVLVAQVLPRWQLMRHAARHVKVILEGQGSDEMLAGYPNLYFAPWMLDELGRLGGRATFATMRAVSAAAIAIYRRYGIQPFRVLGGGFRPLHRLRRMRGVSDDRDILTSDFRASAPPPPAPHEAGLFADRLTRAMHRHHGRTILPHLLMFGDAISMAHSLESRLPFLDYRLVELVFQLEPREKFDGVESKRVMRRALRAIVPAEILARTDKVGFATPLVAWLRERLDADVRPLLLSERARRRGIVDPAWIAAALRRLATGDGAPSGAIFRCLALETWFRLFVDGAGRRPSARDVDAPREPLVDQRSRFGLSPGPAT